MEIESDLSFTVEDDQRRTADEQGRPLPGFFDSLLDKERWAPAAAAALSVRTVVEPWLDGRGYRQELAGVTPAGAWEEFGTSRLSGTRTTRLRLHWALSAAAHPLSERVRRRRADFNRMAIDSPA